MATGYILLIIAISIALLLAYRYTKYAWRVNQVQNWYALWSKYQANNKYADEEAHKNYSIEINFHYSEIERILRESRANHGLIREITSYQTSWADRIQDMFIQSIGYFSARRNETFSLFYWERVIRSMYRNTSRIFGVAPDSALGQFINLNAQIATIIGTIYLFWSAK